MDAADTILDLHPYAMVAGGDAIARHDDGRVVFVEGGLPDEHVRVSVVSEGRDYWRSRVIEVVEASPLRTTPSCPEVARGCGSCQWQHVSVPGQRALKRQVVEDALRRLARIAEPVVEPLVELPASGYRTTVRAAVVGGRAGYRMSGRHDVVGVDSCEVAHPLVEDLLVHGTYGSAHEVVLRCGARTGDRLVAPDPDFAVATVPADVRRDHLREVVAGRTWRISARSFFQSRPDGAEALVDLVTAAVDGVPTGIAIDLYSGVGLFAGVLVDQGWSVTAVEGSRHAAADARMNLRGDGVDVVRTDVTKWRGGRADLTVANPGRKGLGADGVATVVATGAERVVLVSCDVGAFGRDTGLLRRAGYALTSASPVDMFPHTFHVEVVSVFDREHPTA